MGIRVKMEFRNRTIVTTVAAKGNKCLSSLNNFKEFIYKNIPELEGKNGKNPSEKRSFELDIQCEDKNGAFVTIRRNADLKRTLDCAASEFTFRINAKKQAPAGGSTEQKMDSNSVASSSSRSKWKRPHRSGGGPGFGHPTAKNKMNQKAAATCPSNVVATDFGSWLRQQNEHDPIDNIAYFSKDVGSEAILSPADTNHYLGEEFRSIAIVPGKSELLRPQMSSDLPLNLVGERYTSVLNYLETHFRLLREDFIDPLRQGIKAYRNNVPSREVTIYQQVRLEGYRCGFEGVEHVLSFQVQGQPISEDSDSRRLIYGTLVCLSSDGFQQSFIFGVVAGAGYRGQKKTGFKTTVGIRVVKSSEVGIGGAVAAIEKGRTYVMGKSTTAYFEAYYHVLKTLQRKDMEIIPFTKYLLDLEQRVDPPSYLRGRAQGDEFDFATVFPSMEADIGKSMIHILDDWPIWPTTLGKAQLQALKHGLTKELAIIQGPPGTGKTFLGLLLVRLLLANFKCEPAKNSLQVSGSNCVPSFDPTRHETVTATESHGRKGPILIICMTNHALDQFLEGIYKFEKNIIRLGSRSKSSILQKCTLKNLKRSRRKTYKALFAGHRQLRSLASLEQASCRKQVLRCVRMTDAIRINSTEQLKGIATEAQIRSLFSVGLQPRETLERWLAGDPRLQLGDQKEELILTRPLGFNDDGIEDGNIPTLIAKLEGLGIEDIPRHKIDILVDFPDLWQLNKQQRGILHNNWLEKIRMRFRSQQQALTEKYQKSCQKLRKINDEINLLILRTANVVGLTTTAAARNHEILSALNSEILIVEEAAEVLEAHILASLSNRVKHLVLIGDHLQLRPSTAVQKLGTKHKLEVSMFERLVEGGVEHVMLQEQRRMRPSFSKLVRSLYPELKDHSSVGLFDHIRGVNSNLMFFDHTAEESSSTSVDTSKVNITEAKLIVELTLYLLKQDCYSAQNIAVLSMYSGQVAEIKRIMKERAESRFSWKYFERIRKMQNAKNHGQLKDKEKEDDDLANLLPRVSSVDDFQGEEADIIILSLVRSNDIRTTEGEGTIGFLKTANRVCVALTRAKKGMYIFGNATLLAKRSCLWNEVVGSLRNDNALGTKLELVCQNHPKTKTVITKERDFKQVVDGGCSRPCQVKLDCGHMCPRRCHPGPHDDVSCPKPCRRKFSDCKHTCGKVCHGSRHCPPCDCDYGMIG